MPAIREPDAEVVLENLHQRPIRDAGSIRKASTATNNDLALARDPGQELADKS